jgi:hypothetical protein
MPLDMEWPAIATSLEEKAIPPRPPQNECTVAPLSSPLWDMMSACFVNSPDERPDAALLYEFLTTYDYFDDADASHQRARILRGEYISLKGIQLSY